MATARGKRNNAVKIVEAKPAVPTEPFTIVTAPRAYGQKVELTAKYAKIGTPKNFIGLKLRDHQKVIVKAILDLEDAQGLEIVGPEFDSRTVGPTIVRSSGMVLSEPFGSGKTIDILALILMRQTPRAYRPYMNAVIIPDARNQYMHNQPGERYTHEILRQFTGRDALLRPNLIVVGNSVLTQWEEAITQFTSLKVLLVGDCHRLKILYKAYKNKTLKGYDIVLLKNGNVTGNFVLDDEKSSDMAAFRSMIYVVGKMTRKSCWSRVIYDDFDTINIPTGSTAINALFSIYISATTKTPAMSRPPKVQYESILDMLRERSIPLNLITHDKNLFSMFNVANAHGFVEDSTRITKIEGFRYVYDNPDDNYMRLLGVMGDADANELLEMLNGDAVATAADKLGIKTGSVATIFQKMLDKKYEKFLHDKDVLETLVRARDEALALDPHERFKQHKAAKLDKFRTAITHKNVPKFGYYSEALLRFLDELSAEYEMLKERDGMAIGRVIDNIKEGMCQVCALPLDGFDIFIVKCCGLIVCDVCGIKGNQIQKRYDYKTKTHTICGSCANCKATIYLQTDLIFVDKNFDMSALLEAKGDEQAAEPIVEPEPAASAAVVPVIKNPKIRALMALINNTLPESRESVEVNIQHLLLGTINIPQTTESRKILVFANFNETLGLIEDVLVENNVTFLRLKGSYQEKAETVKKFRTYGTVLLINSQQHCAGLNIQFATDLCFMHKIMDPNIEAQVAGRGQRMMRTCNLRIHYFMYANERAL